MSLGDGALKQDGRKAGIDTEIRENQIKIFGNAA